jgi:hypothetical protein
MSSNFTCLSKHRRKSKHYQLTNDHMADKKVFRVFITERYGFYVDTEAESAREAKVKIEQRLDDHNDHIQPIENPDAYTGYQVDHAVQIYREDADLE